MDLASIFLDTGHGKAQLPVPMGHSGSRLFGLGCGCLAQDRKQLGENFFKEYTRPCRGPGISSFELVASP